MASTALPNRTLSKMHSIPETATSHPNDPIPEESIQTRKMSVAVEGNAESPQSSSRSVAMSDRSDLESGITTPPTELSSNESEDEIIQDGATSKTRKRRASTVLLSENSDDVLRILGKGVGTEMIRAACCGGGCCMLKELKARDQFAPEVALSLPENEAFNSLGLKLGTLGLDSELSGVVDMPPKTITFESLAGQAATTKEDTTKHPPSFVTPHPPYSVFSAPLFHARELTQPGAEKRTYHFDLDITDYPTESGDVEFVVGGAIGVCAPNPPELVNAIFDHLAIPGFVRDKPVLMKTSTGRWPTIWGDEKPRELVTTRRELLTWCSDVQSYPPTKALLRLLAEHTDNEHEKKILTYLSAAQGQGAFCDLRTGPYISLLQLLTAFPSCHPPLDHLLSNLNTLMPRFYSLSQDPQVSCLRDGTNRRRLIEVAVTIHESPEFNGTKRKGIGSGFLESLANQVIEAEKQGKNIRDLDLRVPMFRGLMANPLAKEFVSDGPMLLIGAGVGVAPFRGFIHNRLKSANCANKVWILQGVRDSLLDELYAGDWGVHENKVKKVVQSRRGEGRYVQDEIRNQADLVWFVINALDGRVFAVGGTGMGVGVEKALVDVAMAKGNLNEDEAKLFWKDKKAVGQYIAETW